MKLRLTYLVIFLILFCSIVPVVSCKTVFVNSENWRDVFSGIHYSNLNAHKGIFVTSENHVKLLSEGNGYGDILILESQKEPYVIGMKSFFSEAEEMKSTNFNLKLAEELDVHNYIIVDSSYGYNAVAVVPYALKTNSWIFFVDELNIGQVEDILEEKEVKNILVYGYVDRVVRESLAEYSPRVINNNDKFKDNVEIVEEFLRLKETYQVLLTNGEFLENELMAGKEPILFTGDENVPDVIRDYLSESQITVGVLIGNDLMNAATNIKGSTGVSVMVKFARGSRGQLQGVSAIEGLDLFPLPKPILDLDFYSVQYNKASRQLEVTYESQSNVPVYFKGTFTVSGGEKQKKVGDQESVFIAPGNYKTVKYDLEEVFSGDLSLDAYVLFGESESSLDYALESEMPIDVVDVIDSCTFEINKIVYNKQRKQFEVSVKNPSEMDCWIEVSLEDLFVGYEQKTVSSGSAEFVESGDKANVIIEEELVDEDFEKNENVNYVAYFGQKEMFLVNVLEGTMKLNIRMFSNMVYLIVLIFLIIVALSFLFFWRKRKEDKGEFDW